MALTHTLIKSWITLVTGEDSNHIIRQNSNGPRPDVTFYSFEIISHLPGDFSDKKVETSGTYDNDYTLTRKYYSLVSVNMYNPDNDALQTFGELVQSNYRSDVSALLKPEQVTLLGSGAIRDLTSIGDTKNRRRLQADFDFTSFEEVEWSEVNERYNIVRITGDWLPDIEIEIEVP